MTSNAPACPHCKQADKTYKVSLLFLESTARLHQHQVDNQPELDGLLADLFDGRDSPVSQAQFLSRLSQTLTPPGGEKHTTRRIHPDSLVIFFTLLSSLIVYKVSTSKPDQLPIILMLLGGSILVYLIARKSVVRRYEEKIRQEKDENLRVENAISHWMRLYFCSRDQGVFVPEQNRFVPLERMSDLLYES